MLLEAARRAIHEIDAEAADSLGLDAVPVVSAKASDHGDFASSAALALAGRLGRPPREIAERIVAELSGSGLPLARIEIAGPGFINFFLEPDQWHEVLAQALRQGDRYGTSDAGRAERVQVEFVSANPTGPLTIGHGRNAVLGDAIARLLEATGHQVSREYYFNDGGRQMRLLADSLRARYEQQLGREAALPEGGYQGAYLAEIAEDLVGEHGEAWLTADWTDFRDRAKANIFGVIKKTLDRLGIHFATYYNEHSLYEAGHVDAVLEDLRKRGLVYERDGATWLRSTDLHLDRDRVLVKSSGEATYLLPDVAYHRDKLRRGFQRVIDVLGPDHIEQFPYVKAATDALGCDASRLELVIYQWVNLRRGEELIKMSTRESSFVTVDEVLDEVGPDVFRYFMIDRRADTHLDFDLALAKDRSERNPVYKIQYAHARLCSIERIALERGIEQTDPESPSLKLLEDREEIDLAKRVGRFPEVVVKAMRDREPQEVARYLLGLASTFHTYVSDSRNHRILSDDPQLSQARLGLSRGVRLVLANGLGLLGISAPERM